MTANAPDAFSSPTPAAAPVRRRRSRWVFVVWTLLASLVLLEVVLQIGAFAVWQLGRKPAEVPSVAGHTVLCVGDSWTHGMGSTNPSSLSYPAVLEKLLNERSDKQWTVVNCGQAGQNSRDVLERLPSQLRQYRPKILCVLIGGNDFWSRPEVLPVDEQNAGVDHTTYRFRWRLPRLVLWVAGKITGSGQTANTRDGDEWAPKKGNYTNPYWSLPNPATPDAETQALTAEAWRRADAKDFVGARDWFERALARNPADAGCRAALASMMRSAGAAKDAIVHIDWLREAWRRDPSFWNGSALVNALDNCGYWQESLDVVVPFLERFPDDASMWHRRANAEFFLSMQEPAKRSIDEAIRREPSVWYFVLRARIYYQGEQNYDEAIRSVLASYVAANDASIVEGQLRAAGWRGFAERAHELAKTFPCEPDVRRRLLQITQEVAATYDDSAVGEVLAQHLQHMLAAARNAGATPVLICYPTANEAEAHLRNVANEQGQQFIEMNTLFQRRRGSRSWDSLRSLDGHCNDDGYRMMAEIVADELMASRAVSAR